MNKSSIINILVGICLLISCIAAFGNNHSGNSVFAENVNKHQHVVSDFGNKGESFYTHPLTLHGILPMNAVVESQLIDALYQSIFNIEHVQVKLTHEYYVELDQHISIASPYITIQQFKERYRLIITSVQYDVTISNTNISFILLGPHASIKYWESTMTPTWAAYPHTKRYNLGLQHLIKPYKSNKFINTLSKIINNEYQQQHTKSNIHWSLVKFDINQSLAQRFMQLQNMPVHSCLQRELGTCQAKTAFLKSGTQINPCLAIQCPPVK